MILMEFLGPITDASGVYGVLANEQYYRFRKDTEPASPTFGRVVCEVDPRDARAVESKGDFVRVGPNRAAIDVDAPPASEIGKQEKPVPVTNSRVNGKLKPASERRGAPAKTQVSVDTPDKQPAVAEA